MFLSKKRKRDTQKQRIINQLEEYGEVSNFWAINNYILRLGALIFVLRDEEWIIDGEYSKEKIVGKSNTKNFIYKLIKRPKSKKYGTKEKKSH